MVASRAELTQYCLRALGEPVVEVNVDDSQLEDRIDEALSFWNQYHFDGVEKMYMKQQITASRINLNETNAADFSLGEVVTGATSGAKAKVAREIGLERTGTLLTVKDIVGTFEEGETITGTDSGQTATVDTVVKGTYDNRYFDLPDLVYGVTRVFSFNQGSSSKNLFDIQYQLRLNDLYDLASTSIIYYKTVMSHLSLLNLELNGHPLYRFNRRQGRLFLDVNWESNLVLGEYVVIECYRALDPNEWTKVWDEPWLKHYTTALFKRQWAVNIKKFSGIELPGGITLDGNQLYAEAVKEIEDLEQELMNKSAPLEFFLG